MGITTKSRTVFQFHGCHFQGCPTCYPDREYVLHQEKGKNMTREDVYQRTLRRNEVFVQAEYNLVVRWEHEKPTPVRCRLHRNKMWRFLSPLCSTSSRTKTPEQGRHPQVIWFSRASTFHLGISCRHFQPRAGVYLPQRPKRAVAVVLGSARKKSKSFKRAGETGEHARRLWASVESSEGDHPRLVRQNPCVGFCTYDPGSALTFSKMQSPFLASRCSIFCAERCRIKMDQSSMPQTRRHIKCSKRPLSAGQASFSQGITKWVNRWFARTCVKMLQLDVNALYPSTMLKPMPCGPGKNENPEEQKQKQFWRPRCLTSLFLIRRRRLFTWFNARFSWIKVRVIIIIIAWCY